MPAIKYIIFEYMHRFIVDLITIGLLDNCKSKVTKNYIIKNGGSNMIDLNIAKCKLLQYFNLYES